MKVLRTLLVAALVVLGLSAPAYAASRTFTIRVTAENVGDLNGIRVNVYDQSTGAEVSSSPKYTTSGEVSFTVPDVAYDLKVTDESGTYVAQTGTAQLGLISKTFTLLHPISCTTTTTAGGVPHVGQSLRAVPGATNYTNPPVVADFQWYRQSPSGAVAQIPGVTGPTYTSTAGELGSLVFALARVSAPGRAFASCGISNKTTIGAPLTAATSGKAKVRKSLAAVGTAVQAGGVATYQWFRTTKKKRKPAVTKPIGGATGSTYTLRKKDRGAKVSVTITYTYGAAATAVSSAAKKVR